MSYTPIVFGKEDIAVVQKPDPLCSVISADVFYTHPDLSTCYSHYGFAYPLNLEGIPLHLLLDNKRLSPPETFKRTPQIYSYFFIDFEGLCWKLAIIPNDQGEYELTQFYIDTKKTGWWITQSVCKGYDVDIQILLGFLYTDPKAESINTFWKKHFVADSLIWFSIKEVVKTLKEKFDEGYSTKSLLKRIDK